jgi:hypothetical protein
VAVIAKLGILSSIGSGTVLDVDHDIGWTSSEMGRKEFRQAEEVVQSASRCLAERAGSGR